ncbi:MAG: hypothetical protein INR65_19820 [Gluconacetobacter diazotrophicus]|nr:hypothetical protein [Gluconacetobacter diazotrophicus]
MNFYASNDSGWELEQVMIPDPGGVTTKVSAWADRFLPVLRRGYESGLSAADLTPGITRDPVRI